MPVENQEPDATPSTLLREFRRAPPQDIAVDPLRRARSSIQPLGESHPDPPFLYALNSVVRSPWKHWKPLAGELAPPGAMANPAKPPPGPS